MTERRRRSSKPPPAAPSEASPDLVPRPTRDVSAGRYSMTSDAPPPRKTSTNPPPPLTPPATPPVTSLVTPAATKERAPRIPVDATVPGFAAIDPETLAAELREIHEVREVREARAIDPLPPSTPRVAPVIREKKADVPSLPKIPAPARVPSLEMPKVAPKSTSPETEPELESPPAPELALKVPARKLDASAPDALDSAQKQADFVSPATNVDWQKLWLATQRRLWKSLVVVPTGKEVDAVSVARALASVGGVHLSREVGVIDATQVGLGELKTRLSELRSRTSKGETIVVAVQPLKDNPTSAAFAEAADAAILCVTLGASNLGDAGAVIDEIGRDRFLGTAVLEPKAKAKP